MKKGITRRRMLAVILCMCFLSVSMSSLFGAVIINASAKDPEEVRTVSEDTKKIKAHLLQQIKEGWDPYSADMTIEEFYALMELFEEGTLPLKEEKTESLSFSSLVSSLMRINMLSINEPGTDVPTPIDDGIIIPRTMFLFSGLQDYEGDDLPPDYDNDIGSEGENYPPGLNPNDEDYKLPPTSWKGVGVKTDPDTGGLRAAVIVNGINDAKPNVAGDVDQELFPEYNGYYVRNVKAEGVEAAILGVIRKGDGEYVYYYMSAKDQSTLVSSTTLPSGAKFIVNYRLNEHEITYKIEMSDGSSVPDGITLDSIFGAARPKKTVDAAYSFDVIAPYGYKVQVFRRASGGNLELTGQPTINNGYPLGAEPIYIMQNGKLMPDASKGPLTMTRNATFYNDSVTEDRTVVAVLTKRPDPVFNAFKLLPNTDNTKTRGTSALRYVHAKDKTTDKDLGMIPYDYEDVYLWANGGESKYAYYSDESSLGDASFNNVKEGNISTADGWGWQSGGEDITNDVKMTYDEETDSYSYQWTFQTNSGDNYLMDTLEINGVAISIPYFPKKNISNVADEIEGAEDGLNTWFRESTLPDGAVVKVEMLMSFTGNPQHVYRITVTGAHSNVTLTNMNLMQYRSGAPEIAVYNLDGVHADTGDDTLQLLAIEYYSTEGTDNKVPSNTWCKGNLGDVLVGQPNYNGDTSKHNANIRFKLADGYGEPYYLFEKVRSGREIIKDQASATRQADGSIISKRAVQSLEGVEGPLDSKYIYGPDEDGWYYIHLTEQSDKMALLSIVAVPVKYVVRYLPENLPAVTDEENPVPERAPTNMPEFEHNENCHPSFYADTDNGIPSEQYDDNWGNYYDMSTNTTINISSVVPQDPSNWYKFVDWVVVDANGDPVTKQPVTQQVTDINTNESKDKEIHITSSHGLNVNDVNEYSIENDGLGGSDVSVRVIRLKPTWTRIKNPFKYSVVVNWVDSMGELHKEYFDGYWDDVLTESPEEDNSLTVFVNKDAEPLQRWLEEHPTYTFWDDVNNAVDDSSGTDEDKIKASMNTLYPELAARVNSEEDDSLYNIILRELLEMDISSGLSDSGSDVKPNGKDDFSRLSGYAFSVHENGGRIVIWMCEEKSGLEIRSDLQDDPLSDDEEFYYTINASAGPNYLPLEGIYKAYPEGYVGKDAEGNDQRRIIDEETGEDRIMMDYDAWLVKFENGKIANIIKNTEGATFPDNPVNPVTYFTIKGSKDDRVNKGIILYAPIGNYTVAEVGNKSGGSYKLKLEYTNDPLFKDGLVEWDDNIPSNNQWLRGSEKRYITVNDSDYGKIQDGTLSQVTAGIKYNKGSHNMLYIMHFHNQTSSLDIGNVVGGRSGPDTAFPYEVKLNLPDNVKPLWEKGDSENPGYYYFNYKQGIVDYSKDENGIVTPSTSGRIVLTELDEDPDGFDWIGTVNVKSQERISIILSVPEQSVPKQRDSEEAVPANYSVHEGPIPEMYILKKITASSSKAGNDDAFTISKEDSKSTGMLSAVENHTITFYHVRGIILPNAGAPGVMPICLFGVPLIVVGLYLRRRRTA